MGTLTEREREVAVATGHGLTNAVIGERLYMSPATVKQHLGSVVKAYLIGHSARDFALQIGETPHEICETMERAVARAAEEAEAGEVVLLAPAAASFDQYPNFEKRGEDFTARVKALIFVAEKGALCQGWRVWFRGMRCARRSRRRLVWC